MAGDAVAEIDGPGEGRRAAVGIVGEAGEEAADAAGGDTDGEWDGKEIAGAGTDAKAPLSDLDGEPSTEEAADDGFAAAGRDGLPESDGCAGHFSEQAEDAAAE